MPDQSIHNGISFYSGMGRRIQLWVLLILAFLLLWYTGVRAHLLSMTHDEAHTVNAFMKINVWNCFWNIGCWEIANNHLLNTFLIQKSINLFGMSEFTIRLPNLLAHLIYLLSTIGILRNTTKDTWLIIAGFCILNINPYMLDFFSMARGYGLFVGFMMASLFGLLKFLKEPKVWWALFIYIMLFFSILSNFTAINPALCILTIYIFLVLFLWQINTIERKQLWGLFSIPVVWIGLLSWLLFLPVNSLKSKGEFLWGAPSILDTFTILLTDSLYHEAYFGNATLIIFSWLLIILFAMILLIGIYSFFRDYYDSKNLYLFTIASVLFGSCFFMILQHWILGSQYLVNRKAIHFIPLITLGAYLLLLRWKPSRARYIFSFVVIAFLVNHFIRTFNLEGTREWYYDVDTREMMIELNSLSTDEKKISLGTNWLFMPSANFYKSYFNYDFLDALVYSKEIFTDGRYDYYYVEGGDYDHLKDLYDVQKEYGGGRLLLRIK